MTPSVLDCCTLEVDNVRKCILLLQWTVHHCVIICLAAPPSVAEALIGTWVDISESAWGTSRCC